MRHVSVIWLIGHIIFFYQNEGSFLQMDIIYIQWKTFLNVKEIEWSVNNDDW